MYAHREQRIGRVTSPRIGSDGAGDQPGSSTCATSSEQVSARIFRPFSTMQSARECAFRFAEIATLQSDDREIIASIRMRWRARLSGCIFASRLWWRSFVEINYLVTAWRKNWKALQLVLWSPSIHSIVIVRLCNGQSPRNQKIIIMLQLLWSDTFW